MPLGKSAPLKCGETGCFGIMQHTLSSVSWAIFHSNWYRCSHTHNLLSRGLAFWNFLDWWKCYSPVYMMKFEQGWCKWRTILPSSALWIRCNPEGENRLHTLIYTHISFNNDTFWDAISMQACASLEPNYQPPVTFIVVQKRHHTRLFANNHRDRSSTDKSGNILPGKLSIPKMAYVYKCIAESYFIFKMIV